MAHDDGDRSSFDEARVRQILRRAIEIDERIANTMGVDELRTIAAAVGIRSEAVDQALAEMRRAEKRRKRSLKALRWIRRLMAAGGALMVGLMTTLVSAMSGGVADRAVMAAGVSVVALVVLMLALYNRFRGDQRTYQLDNAVIWVLFVMGSRAVHLGGIHPGVIAWFLLALLGTLVIGRRQSEPPRLGREPVVERAFGFLRDESRRDGPDFDTRFSGVRILT